MKNQLKREQIALLQVIADNLSMINFTMASALANDLADDDMLAYAKEFGDMAESLKEGR